MRLSLPIPSADLSMFAPRIHRNLPRRLIKEIFNARKALDACLISSGFGAKFNVHWHRRAVSAWAQRWGAARKTRQSAGHINFTHEFPWPVSLLAPTTFCQDRKDRDGGFLHARNSGFETTSIRLARGFASSGNFWSPTRCIDGRTFLYE